VWVVISLLWNNYGQYGMPWVGVTKAGKHVERNIDARTRNYWWRRKAVRITCSECVFVALGIQHAKRMRCIILWSVACLALPCFFRISHKRHDFRKESYWTKMCVLIFCTTLLWNISPSKKNTARYFHKYT